MLPTAREKTKEIALKRPETILPSIFGLGLGIFGLAISSQLLMTLGGIGILLGISFWGINYFLRSDQMLSIYFKQREKQFARENQLKLKNLKGVFLQSQLIRDARSYGQQGFEQFELIEKKFKTIEEVLGQKFNPGELTHRKFLATAIEINNAIIDNLTKAAEILNSLAAIDSDYINKRIDKLQNNPELSNADEEELKSLSNRIKLKDEELAKINSILSLNEQAMTKLDEARSAIVAVQTTKGTAKQDLDKTMQQLEYIIQSASKYKVK